MYEIAAILIWFLLTKFLLIRLEGESEIAKIS